MGNNEMQEVWKDIKGFEQYYQISNMGRVQSKDRKVMGGQGLHTKKGKILKPQPNSNGYLRVQLKADGVSVRHFVHRLVAEMFIPKIEGKDIVNHMDSNFLNNNASNLEWVTLKGNMRHAINKGRFDKSFAMTMDKFRADRELKQRPVIGTDIKSGEKVYFPTINEAGRNFNNAAGDICRCCQGIRQTAQGYKWEYIIETLSQSEADRMIKEWGAK